MKLNAAARLTAAIDPRDIVADVNQMMKHIGVRGTKVSIQHPHGHATMEVVTDNANAYKVQQAIEHHSKFKQHLGKAEVKRQGHAEILLYQLYNMEGVDTDSLYEYD